MVEIQYFVLHHLTCCKEDGHIQKISTITQYYSARVRSSPTGAFHSFWSRRCQDKSISIYIFLIME